MALAGRAAEEVFLDKISSGAQNDLQKVTQLVTEKRQDNTREEKHTTTRARSKKQEANERQREGGRTRKEKRSEAQGRTDAQRQNRTEKNIRSRRNHEQHNKAIRANKQTCLSPSLWSCLCSVVRCVLCVCVVPFVGVSFLFFSFVVLALVLVHVGPWCARVWSLCCLVVVVMCRLMRK